jgi:hypothetical protein
MKLHLMTVADIQILASARAKKNKSTLDIELHHQAIIRGFTSWADLLHWRSS